MRQPEELSHAAAQPGLEIAEARRGALLLGGKAIEHAMKPAHRRELIDRAFSVPALSALSLEPRHARFRFTPNGASTRDFLKSLAKAMRAPKWEQFPLADLDLIALISHDRPVEIHRAAGRLTFLRVKELSPERYRFYHPEFRDDTVRDAVISELMGIAYLGGQRGSGWPGCYVEAAFQEGRMALAGLIEIIESALLATIASASRNPGQPFNFRKQLVDTNLALAVLSDFLLPPARLLSVATLWMLNARHFEPTVRAVRTWKVNLHVLYTTIALLTLFSFSFIGSAVMYWTFEFWPRRVKKLREAELAKFLARLKRCPRSVWVDRDRTEMEVDLNHLQLGDTVILRQGDVAPGDGLLISGSVTVAESWTAGAHRRHAGDIIHCSGQIIGGEARMRLDTLGTGSVTATLAEWHSHAVLAPVSDERVNRTATSAVLPALALAVVALFRGGFGMAKGVIRPDYVTGPMVSRNLGWVASVIRAARNGVFIGNDSDLDKLARCDCFIISPEIPWRPGAQAAEDIGQQLRDLGVDDLLSPMGGSNGRHTLMVLRKGIGEPRSIDAGLLIKERQFLGKEVAFIGDCREHPEAAALANIAIHVCEPPFDTAPPAGIALFNPTLDSLLTLRAIATSYNERSKASFATALIPNVACVIGALYFGVPILGVVTLTNAGTLANYLQGRRALQQAAL
jgi:hypothetical protein